MKNLIIFTVASFFLVSCNKDDTITASETAFDTLALNKTFIVHSISGADTVTFSNYAFTFVQSGRTSGTLSANDDHVNFNGSWSATNDFNTLSIVFTSTASPEFRFFNNTWNITELTSTSLHLTATEGNKMVNFIKKN